MNLRERIAGIGAGLLLLPWLGLAALTLGSAPYGLAEEGAKALLVAWSIGDAVASAAFALGAPDIRVLLFLPLGFAFPGQLIAARVLTLLALLAAGVALYRWRRRGEQGEAALLATGLLLITPLCISGIDALSAAPFLLLSFAVADWLNGTLRRELRSLGASFFAQLLVCAAAVSLHPAGMAFPALLMIAWLKAPPEDRHRAHFLVAIPLVTLLVLVMRLGWPGMHWLQNPLPAAAAVFAGSGSAASASAGYELAGAALIALSILVGVHERRRLLSDLTGGMLLLGALFGTVAADETWSVLLLALLLYGGLPWLLRACAPLAGKGLMVQRGWLWLLLLLLCTVFMRTDRAAFEAQRANRLSAQDQLLQEFADGLNSLHGADAPGGAAAAQVLVASSWPARTSIACRCDGLPLPPVAKDPDSQLAMMKNVSYMILGEDADQGPLAANLAQLGRHVEVLAREPGGVILRLRQP